MLVGYWLAVNTGKTKYMEIGRHLGMMANEHITVGSNMYEKLKTCKYLGSLLTNQNFIYDKIYVDLKQDIHVIVQPKHSCLLDIPRRIGKLKYI